MVDLNTLTVSIRRRSGFFVKVFQYVATACLWQDDDLFFFGIKMHFAGQRKHLQHS